MTEKTSRAGRLVTLAVAAAALVAAGAPLSPAKAQLLGDIYLGWDFGNGFGIGVGQVPSARNPCPTYGWPYYPWRCTAPVMAPAPAPLIR
ncbi:MAG: hypothetical protein JO162_03690 [Alphaproteobacteria bacterium]|nr:hypothetical protein [Alphaproteobacteria bacterium]MBV9015197.1 hypothetical protein [Alphaproteobacteria bacterium]